MHVAKENIFNFNKGDLESFLKTHNIQPYRKDQIWNWLYVQGIKSFLDMHNLSDSTKKLLDNRFSIPLLEVKQAFTSKDGTKKWLFKLKDGKEVETVFIPDGKRGTICVSSQVGCALSCSF